MITIGVLALQGAFAEHIEVLRKLKVDIRQIRRSSHWSANFDGLIIPGGESTVMAKLLRDLGLMSDIRQAVEEGMPVFGTCSGLILLAREVVDDDPKGLRSMDITVRRNAYGRQLSSFFTRGCFAGQEGVPMVFIRAPRIESVGEEVEVLSTVGGNISAARQKNMLVTAFHPELTEDSTIHSYFLSMVKEKTKNKKNS